jgi:hypothetical protein
VTESEQSAETDEQSRPDGADGKDEQLRLGSQADAALTALLEAGPEAVDHLLKAAQELLLAARAVVDAGERAVASHRAGSDDPAHPNDAPDRDPRVRRIDLA